MESRVGEAVPRLGDARVAGDEVAEDLLGVPQFLGTGPGVGRLNAAGIAVQEGILPTAAAVARLAVPRAVRGEGIDAAQAAPLYIRDKVAKTVAERLSEGGRA